MKLLFILDTVEFPLAPTPALARRVAGLLAGRGHQVHLLELWDGETPPPAAPGCQSHPLAFADERRMNRALEFGRAGGTPVPLRLLRLASMPDAALAAVRQIALKRPRRLAAAVRAIEMLDRRAGGFDAAVAVAAPYAGSFALAEAAIPGRKIDWQMDPYAGNASYAAPGAWKRERRLAQAMDRLLVTPAMTRYYAPGAPLADFSARMEPLDFASLVPPAPVGEAVKSGAGRRRCVFVGSLYPTLRTPHYALELFRALDEPGWELVFVGGGWENYPASLPDACRTVLGDRLVITGPLPRAEAERYLAGADVLLSLGNDLDNQVPSKLFEYFAAGLPVLHLAKRADDPCLAYFDRWPLALCLAEAEGTGSGVLARLSRFLRAVAGRRLPYDQARQLFAANTPEYAADVVEAACAGTR
ncbi:MAG TPA: glycosyltransferase [Candidatus Fournierella merdigallinarum]|nr:glycosyltransferase [Candidatus Fournierella merdigallinarum]